MKTFDYYLDEVAKESGFTGFAPAFMNSSEILKITRESNKRYTTAAIKEHLSRAANESLLTKVGMSIEQWQVLHKSITNIPIELP